MLPKNNIGLFNREFCDMDFDIKIRILAIFWPFDQSLIAMSRDSHSKMFLLPLANGSLSMVEETKDGGHFHTSAAIGWSIGQWQPSWDETRSLIG